MHDQAAPLRADYLYWVTRRIDDTAGRGVLYVLPLPVETRMAFTDEAALGVYLGEELYQLVLITPAGDFVVFDEGPCPGAPDVGLARLAEFKRKAWDGAEKFLKTLDAFSVRMRAYKERVVPEVNRRVVITGGILDDVQPPSPPPSQPPSGGEPGAEPG